MLFGVKSTFNEELYTTKLEKGPQTRELEKQALRIAREIEGEETQDLHLAEVVVASMAFSPFVNSCNFLFNYLFGFLKLIFINRKEAFTITLILMKKPDSLQSIGVTLLMMLDMMKTRTSCWIHTILKRLIIFMV